MMSSINGVHTPRQWPTGLACHAWPVVGVDVLGLGRCLWKLTMQQGGERLLAWYSERPYSTRARSMANDQSLGPHRALSPGELIHLIAGTDAEALRRLPAPENTTLARASTEHLFQIALVFLRQLKAVLLNEVTLPAAPTNGKVGSIHSRELTRLHLGRLVIHGNSELSP
jgi:hypothetical protein